MNRMFWSSRTCITKYFRNGMTCNMKQNMILQNVLGTSLKQCQCCCFSTSQCDTTKNDDKDIEASLKSVLGDASDKTCSNNIVPGKGRPPEPPVDCCMSGCANCVWIQYAEELKLYYSDGTDRAVIEINKIENPSLKAFIKLELGLS